MKRTILAAVAALACSGAAVSARGAPIDPVHVRTDFGVEGNGVRFLTGDKCVMVTAHHVISGSSQPMVTPIRSPQDRAGVVKSDKVNDVGLALQENAQSRSCAPFPSDQAIEEALFSDKREVWYVSESGDLVVLEVGLVRRSDRELQLALRPNPAIANSPSNFSPGMSGAVVVFGGQPVATLRSLETAAPVANATRLDFVRRQYADVFRTQAPAKPVQAKPARSYAPFALEQLPAEYRDVVRRARETKRRAEQVATQADNAKRRAVDASLIAKSYPKDDVVKGHAQFDADNGNYYAGEVYVVGIQKGGQGYGVSETGKGDNVGDKWFCRSLRDIGCEGPGVLEYAANAGNINQLERWRGNMTRGSRGGLGHLSWQSGAEAWFVSDSAEVEPGIWRTSDGRLYEGEMKGNWEGRGVLWNKDGVLIAVGIYKAGELVQSALP